MRRLEKRMRLIRLIPSIWFAFAVVVFTVQGLIVAGEILSLQRFVVSASFLSMSAFSLSIFAS
jgi:hypothetical protein